MSISDHNAILFKMVPSRREKSQLWNDGLFFNIRKANWELFDQEVGEVFSSSLKNRLAYLKAEQAVTLMTRELQDSCKRTIGIRRN